MGGMAYLFRSSNESVLWLTLHRQETQGFRVFYTSYSIVRQISPLAYSSWFVFFWMTLGWCLTAHWRVLHAVNRVDVRMRILGSFSTAHWLNPPYTAVRIWNLHFGFQEVTVPWNPGFRVSGYRLTPVPLGEALVLL